MRTATKKEIDFINQYRAKAELAPEDVYVETFLLTNNAFIPKYGMFLHPKAVKQTAEKAGRKDWNGMNFKVMHSRDNVVSLGKSFAGAYDKASSSSFAKFYFPVGFKENGYSVDDLVKGIAAGIYAETSWGFSRWPMKEKSMQCSLCGGNPLWFRAYYGGEGEFCGHWPGEEYAATPAIVDFIAKNKDAGMDSYPGMKAPKEGDNVECRMWMMDTEDTIDELSLVDRGASESRPVRDDEIPVKFAAAQEYPALKLAASKASGGQTPGFVISIPLNTVSFEGEDSPEDKEMLGEHVVNVAQKTHQFEGGETKLKKTFNEKVKAALAALGDDEPETEVPATTPSASDARLKEVEGTLASVGYDGKDLSAFVASLTASRQDADKFKAIPEDLRVKLDKTELSWPEVSDYIRTCEKELDEICTAAGNAAVAAQGNDVKTDELVSGIKMKAKVLGLAAALTYGKQMIAAYAGQQAVKPGQVTDPTASVVGDEEPEVVAARETKRLKDMAAATAVKFFGVN